MTSGSIASSASSSGNLLLRRVFYLSGDSLTLTQGDIMVSRENGEITVEPGTASGAVKRDHMGNGVAGPGVSWVLDGAGDNQYLVLPALSNVVEIGVRKELAGFFSQEEISSGKLANVDQLVHDVLEKNLRAGVSNITLNLIGETAADKDLVETCLKETKLRGKVLVAGDSQAADYVYFKQGLALGSPVFPGSFAEDKSVAIGTGNPKISSSDIWLEYQSIAMDLLSRNGGKFPLKAESLLKNAFWGGGKLNTIKTGSAADLIIVKLGPFQQPLQGAQTVLLKGEASSVQAVIRRGTFIHLQDELNHQIVPLSSTKTNVNGCEFDSIEEALAEFAKGNFVVVVDNEDRENEGDLIMACEFVTEEKMAFMIRHTSGLVCIATSAKRLAELELPLMVAANNESFKTAFTVSVDYTHGTTTGISAADRAITARAIANPEVKPQDFNRPGHMFPLRATEGGVIRRMGHTEATVDLCKLSGTYPAGILCEIALDNGKMARRDYLRNFATEHGLKMITIADMIAYRKKHGLLDI